VNVTDPIPRTDLSVTLARLAPLLAGAFLLMLGSGLLTTLLVLIVTVAAWVLLRLCAGFRVSALLALPLTHELKLPLDPDPPSA
jgi:hypothetical protein